MLYKIKKNPQLSLISFMYNFLVGWGGVGGYSLFSSSSVVNSCFMPVEQNLGAIRPFRRQVALILLLKNKPRAPRFCRCSTKYEIFLFLSCVTRYKIFIFTSTSTVTSNLEVNGASMSDPENHRIHVNSISATADLCLGQKIIAICEMR